jgi:hypothetical protein
MPLRRHAMNVVGNSTGSSASTPRRKGAPPLSVRVPEDSGADAEPVMVAATAGAPASVVTAGDRVDRRRALAAELGIPSPSQYSPLSRSRRIAREAVAAKFLDTLALSDSSCAHLVKTREVLAPVLAEALSDKLETGGSDKWPAALRALRDLQADLNRENSVTP